MPAFVVGPVKIRLGDKVYQEVMYVSPIDDDMLLGIDFLKKHGARLDMRRNELEIGEEIFGFQLWESSSEPVIACVTVKKRKIIPPNSVAKINCKLSRNLNEYMVKAEPHHDYLIPCTIYDMGKEANVCVMNVSDKFVVMKKGKEMGIASELDQEIFEKVEEKKVMEAQEDGLDSPNGNIPSHIKIVIDASKEHLTDEHIQQLTDCLVEYQDVFAKNEFDLGDFTEIEHAIDTKDAQPIKERIRRTPACFVGEEEAHLKMWLRILESKKISNDQELIQSNPTSCPQNQKGNN